MKNKTIYADFSTKKVLKKDNLIENVDSDIITELERKIKTIKNMQLSDSVKDAIINKELAIFESKQNLELMKHELKFEVSKSEEDLVKHIRNITTLHFNNLYASNSIELYTSCSVVLDFLKQKFVVFEQKDSLQLDIRRGFNSGGCESSLKGLRDELQNIRNGKKSITYESIHSLCAVSNAISSTIYMILTDKKAKDFFFNGLFDNVENPEDFISKENEKTFEDNVKKIRTAEEIAAISEMEHAERVQAEKARTAFDSFEEKDLPL
ncbi:MAG: hypothetical protein CL760_06170 [Chloroflexi bacterium]|nr:hypothetical protein [Chloroflexota bacterium]|tara:strand:+ start:34032 stop:34829 length:798 start_codon:yes stop_codon:yes gene_type:complete